MEPEFIHVEKDLAIEAWIMYAFKIYDILLEEDFEFKGWIRANLTQVEHN